MADQQEAIAQILANISGDNTDALREASLAALTQEAKTTPSLSTTIGQALGAALPLLFVDGQARGIAAGTSGKVFENAQKQSRESLESQRQKLEKLAGLGIGIADKKDAAKSKLADFVQKQAIKNEMGFQQKKRLGEAGLLNTGTRLQVSLQDRQPMSDAEVQAVVPDNQPSILRAVAKIKEQTGLNPSRKVLESIIKNRHVDERYLVESAAGEGAIEQLEDLRSSWRNLKAQGDSAVVRWVKERVPEVTGIGEAEKFFSSRVNAMAIQLARQIQGSAQNLSDADRDAAAALMPSASSPIKLGDAKLDSLILAAKLGQRLKDAAIGKDPLSLSEKKQLIQDFRNAMRAAGSKVVTPEVAAKANRIRELDEQIAQIKARQ